MQVSPKRLDLSGRFDITLRLMSHVNQTDHCWLWEGSQTKGYGNIKIDGQNEGVHRVAFALLVAVVPEGMYVLHKCDNPVCVNPEHLFLGTQLDNVQDAMEKGRHCAPTNPQGNNQYAG